MEWLKNLTTSQRWAAYRQYITFGAGILVALGIVTTTQSQDLIKGFADFMAGLQQMLTGLATIGGVVIVVINAWKAAHNAGPVASVQRVQDLVQDTSQPKAAIMDAKNALLTATASLPEVKEVKLEPAAPATPELVSTTPPNVTAAPTVVH